MGLTAVASGVADCAAAVSETRWGLTLVLATIVVIGGVAIVILALGSLVRVGAMLAIPVVIAALLAVQLHTRSDPSDCSPAIAPLPATADRAAPLVSSPPMPPTSVPARSLPAPGLFTPAPTEATPTAPLTAAAGDDAGSGPDAVTATTVAPEVARQVPPAVVVTSAEPAAGALVVTLRSPLGEATVSVEYRTWVDGDGDGAALAWRPVQTAGGTTVVLPTDSDGAAWRPATTHWVQVRATYPSGPGPVSVPYAVQWPGTPDGAGADPVGSAAPTA